MAFGAGSGVGSVTDAMLEKLHAAPAGPAFDMMYVDGQIAGHEALRATYAQGGSDPMARGASMVGVPSIDTHPDMLHGIRPSMA